MMEPKSKRRRSKQDRRSVSMRPQVYKDLVAYCERTKRSMASFVEDLILREIGKDPVAEEESGSNGGPGASMGEEAPKNPPHPISDLVAQEEPPSILFLG